MIKIDFINNKRLALIGFISLLVLSACGSEDASQATAVPLAMPPVEVETVTITTTPLDLTTRLPGRTSAFRVAEVRPQVEGIILKRLFVEGSTVSAGQVLYRIDPVRYESSLEIAEAQLAQSNANLASAQQQYERYRGLVKQKMVSQQTYDDAEAAFTQAQASVQSAEASVRSAKINLNYTEVKAPISGQIGRSSVTEGALVTANQTTALATIQQLDPLYVDLSQPSSDLIRLRRSAGANRNQMSGIKIFLDDGNLVEQEATLQFADVTVSENTGTVTIRALLPNPSRFLMPGLYVRAELPIEHRDAAILVPQAAVSRNPNGSAQVMIVNAESKVEIRQIITKQIIGTSWLVDSGLNPGDNVIVKGLQKVRPGATVSVAQTATTTVPQE